MAAQKQYRDQMRKQRDHGGGRPVIIFVANVQRNKIIGSRDSMTPGANG
jgi:hypothetical protein